MKKIFSSEPILQTEALAFIRVVTGLLMAFHGWEVFDATKIQEYSQWDSFKQYSNPLFMAYLGKGSELVGGVLLTIGLFTRMSALLLVGTMLYISFKVGGGRFWYEDQHPFLFVLLAFLYLFVGGGRYSLDKRIFG